MKYIFEIKIKHGHSVEEYVKAWKKGSKIIQQFPGARGTRLYQKIGEPNVLIAIADWKSKEARDKAMVGIDNITRLDLDTNKVVHAHRKYGRLFPLGGFDEIAKVAKNKS